MPVEAKFINFLHALQQHRRLPHGNHAQVQEHDNRHSHEIFQSSTLNALIGGAYDGDSYATMAILVSGPSTVWMAR